MLDSVITGASMSNPAFSIQLPKSWPATMVSAMLYVVSLAKYAAAAVTMHSLGFGAMDSSKIDALFSEYAKPDCPGASVMVVRDGKVLFAKGYGMADLQARVPCSPNTNFRLASVTKQFTAMAVMILADRKKLSLDETLPEFFPEFPQYGRKVTVRHLLTHTSGLIDYEDVIPSGTTIPVLDRDVLRLLLKQEHTYFPPGTKFKYSNSAYALLALIVEARSGQSFARFLHENVFVPLKMKATLAYEQGISVVNNRAYGYTAGADGKFERTDQSLTSSVLGDGGIYSSVADLGKWDAALYTTKLVRSSTLRQIFTPGPESEKPGAHYGFGWYIGEYRGLKEIWHSGTTRGFSTRIVRYPEKTFTVIILTNRNEAELSDLPHKIADLVLWGGMRMD
jgi:CubicO group peptidase (beta-lactamase class C family)